MNTSTAPVFTLFEVRGQLSRSSLARRSASVANAIAPSCRAICSRSKRGARLRARASSSAARAMEIEALASRQGLGIARLAGRLSGAARQQRADIRARRRAATCCRATYPLRRSWTCRPRRPRPIRFVPGSRGCCLASARFPASPAPASPSPSSTRASPRIRRSHGKVIANVSKVSGDSSTDDAHGHGTHIAGIIAGNSSASKNVTSLYNGGIAPDVKLVNVRVLGANGTGWTSDVIAGIEWVIENRAKYNIRAINLSLGHPVTEPSTTDPLCIAVMKATAAGIVVIVSAGNAGKADNGAPILGGITSPGNSPYAITVGAMNTKGTVNAVRRHHDDLQLARADEVRARREARRGRAGKQDRVARGLGIVPASAITRSSTWRGSGATRTCTSAGRACRRPSSPLALRS